MKIVLAGGTGYLGSLLQNYYKSNNEVIVLSRQRQPTKENVTFLQWDGKSAQTSWGKEILNADVIINLSGRTVDCKYNERNKQEIFDSRTKSTELIGELLATNENNVKLWVNLSSATIYKHCLDQDMTEENGEIGSGFSVEVCKAWEKSFYKYQNPYTRKVALRLAMVMGKDDGPLVPLINLAKVGLGGAHGNGDQFVSWLSEPDFLSIIDYVIDHEDIKGEVNTCSPNPMPNKDFMKSIRKAYKRPFGMNLKPWMLEVGAFFMRTETELVTKSRRVVPRLLIEHGYSFKKPDFQGYINDVAKK